MIASSRGALNWRSVVSTFALREKCSRGNPLSSKVETGVPSAAASAVLCSHAAWRCAGRVLRVAALHAFRPARRGLGAHITLLHANRHSEHPRVDAVAAAIAGSMPFGYRLVRVARFPGTLYLAAELVAPFAQPGMLEAITGEELREKEERLRRYGSPEFTQALLQHAREATKKAKLEMQEPFEP